MIIKISSGGNHARGLVNYMAGPGNNQEHQNQRTIAGGTVHYDGPLDTQTRKQVISDLQMYQNLYPDVEVNGGSIWQCSLAVAPGEGPISDETWGAVANDLMEGLGFIGPDKPDVRWAIFGHGESVNGNPHCHIVMNRINADGKKVNTYRDMVKAQQLAPALEAKYGLKVLESRLATVGAGSVPYTQAEAAETKLQGKVEPDRVNLERQIRAIVATSTSEDDFVGKVKAKGLLLRPYPKAADTYVSGYSVGIRAKGGARQDYFSGGQLARDLTLPQIRRHWDATPESAEAAQQAWRGVAPVKAARPSPAPRAIERAQAELIGAQSDYAAITPEQLADLSHDLAGTLAVASQATETVPGPLAKASRDVGAWAQPRGLSQHAERHHSKTKSAALMFAIAMDPQSPQSQMLMMRQLADMLAALYRLHQASRQVATRERSTVMTQTAQADGLDDFIGDGLTMATVGGSRLVEVHAQNKRADLEKTSAQITPREWAGMAERQRAEIPEQNPQGAAGGKPEWKPWTADDIRRSRHQVRAEQIHQQFMDRPPLATHDQQEAMKDLSARLGLAGMEHAVSGVSKADAAAMIRSMEMAAEGYGSALPEQMLPSRGLTSQTGLGEIASNEDAEAFLARLERSAAKREAEGGPVATPTPAPERTTHAPIMTGNKDPRQWAGAGEAVTPKQAFTLKQAGFSTEEIATLKKGSASYVIGHHSLGEGQARNAYERNAIAGTPASTPATDAARQSRSTQPPTDIRNRNRQGPIRPTQ